MKKVIAFSLIVLTAATMVSPIAMAASTSTAPIVTSASVAAGLSLNVVLKRNDFSGATVTDMNFGQLVNIGTGTLRSSPTSTTGTGAVVAFISSNSQGLPYTLTSTGTTMSNGTTTLPSGALNVVPIYAAADNGGAAKPPAAVVGSAGSWVGTRTLYTSETGAAQARTIQAVYSVTDDPAAGATAGVPLSQPAGTYNGTVVITVTA